MPIDFYTILTILIVLTATFSYINHRFIKLPATIGIMLISLLTSLALVSVGSFYPSFLDRSTQADFNTTVYAYAKTSIAMFDAFIQCWNVKYKYNTVRPETVINKYFDENWRPFLQTPPFPEYTCGHTTVSAAAAEALTSVFGDHLAYTDTSELEFGINNRSFNSFRQAADENIWARFYGGIHFHNSCIISNKQGRMVGEFVNGRLKMKRQ